MSDDWDAIVNMEQNLFNSGLYEGQQYVFSLLDHEKQQQQQHDENEKTGSSYLYDSLSQSLRFGFMKGFTIGAELGYIESTVSYSNDNNSIKIETDFSITNNDNNSYKPVDNNEQDNKQNRIDKRIKNLLIGINEIPSQNSSDVDFDSEIIKIRNLFKHCGIEKPHTIESVLSSLSTSQSFTDKTKQNDISDW